MGDEIGLDAMKSELNTVSPPVNDWIHIKKPRFAKDNSILERYGIENKGAHRIPLANSNEQVDVGGNYVVTRHHGLHHPAPAVARTRIPSRRTSAPAVARTLDQVHHHLLLQRPWWHGGTSWRASSRLLSSIMAHTGGPDTVEIVYRFL
jgi:hypothetical protein